MEYIPYSGLATFALINEAVVLAWEATNFAVKHLKTLFYVLGAGWHPFGAASSGDDTDRPHWRTVGGFLAEASHPQHDKCAQDLQLWR
jgi:hypothetical protein